MHSLSAHARDVENAFFTDKQQCISRSNSISFFNRVSTDHALEQSQIKDSKSSGGIVGTSQDKDTREQWTLTIHMKSLITTRLKEMSGISISIQHNKKLFKKRKKRGENDVYKLIETVKERMINPQDFDNQSDDKSPLINIASGSVAPAEVSESLLESRENGVESDKNFIENRLMSKEFSFWKLVAKANIRISK